jgi:hypothetical protein
MLLGASKKATLATPSGTTTMRRIPRQRPDRPTPDPSHVDASPSDSRLRGWR